MRLFSSLSPVLSILILTGLLIAGCDNSPSSVEDFEVQPNMELSTSSITFVDRQSPPPKLKVSYQGLDKHPKATATGGLEVSKQKEEGSGQDGRQVWNVTYGETLSENFVQEKIKIQSTSGSKKILDSVSVQVNNPISVAKSFESTLASVADYEDGQRARSTQNGTVVQLDSQNVSQKSTGVASLKVDAAASGSFTIERRASLPGMRILSFLVKPNQGSSFNLTVTLKEESGGETRTENITVTVPAGTEWRRYSIAAGPLFPNFDPVAQRAGGTGPLTSVSFSADSDVTYHVDQIMYGTSEEALVEIEDFEHSTNKYTFGGGTFSSSSTVPKASDGFTSLSVKGASGGGFGYNYNNLRMDATGQSAVSMWIGGVKNDFVLFVFLQTNDGKGGYTYGNGVTKKISAGAEWRRVTIPVPKLGGDNADPSQIGKSALFNVGFEVRRLENDDSSAPLTFLIDEVKLVQSTQ